MTSPLQVVREFIAAIEKQDIDAAIMMLAKDVSYENMPMKPVVSPQAVRKVLDGFLKPASEVDWRILSECECGNTVYNERLDRFLINGEWLELPIAGVFKVENGQITLWRDYFDMATYTSQFQRISSKN